MIKLLKQLTFTIGVMIASTMFAQNPTVTFDNVPAEIEATTYNLSASDQLVFTIDNIPDNNTTITANLRVYVAGSTANGSKKTQRTFNIDATSNASDSFYSFVESAGTNANTIKRVYTYTQLIPNTSGSGVGGDYIINETYDILVRLVGGAPSPDDTNSNSVMPATTMKAVADNTLSINKMNIIGSVYPNPVSTKLFISNTVKTNTYKITNLLGNTVKEVKANGSIDVSDLSAGIYVLVTDAGIAKFVKK